MRRLLTLGFGSLLAAASARGTITRGETAPPDSLTRRVDRLFAEWARPNSPGCMLGVVKDGQLVYRRGYGVANLETHAPMSTNTLFYAASVSKQFAAASVLAAAQQGKLSLDDPIQKWVPEVPPYARPITVRHLIHHTSGIRDYLSMWALDASSGDVHTDAELLALIGAQKTTNFEPGTEFSYSNSGYVLLSFIVKRATGQSLREFAQANLFGPLGMTSTFFRDDHRVLPDAKRMAQAYNKGSDGKYRRGFLPNFDKVGDGGLITTVEDLAKWDQSFYSRSLGGGELVRQQLERGILANGDTINYAAGLVVDAYKGLPFVEHEGGFMGYRNDLLRFPEQRFSTIILCNLGTIDAGDLARKVTDLYLENDFRQRLAQFVGDYRSPEVGAVLHVEQRGGDLWVRRKHPPDAILHGARREYGARVKDGENQFTMDSGQESWQVQFEKDASGRVVALLVGADRAKNIRFAKQ